MAYEPLLCYKLRVCEYL